MSRLQTLGNSGSAKPAHTDCYDCNDTGKKGIYYALYTDVAGRRCELRFPNDIIVPCTRCGLGGSAVEQWRKENDCTCSYGFISWSRERVMYFDVCPNCDFGQPYAATILEQKQKALESLITDLRKTSNLAPLQIKQTFSSYVEKPGSIQEKAKGQLKQAAEIQRSVLLVGNTGVGKSHLAAAYLNHVISLGKPGKFVSLIELMSSLRKTIGAKDGPDWDALLETYTICPLLVLDDVGQEKPTEKVNETLFLILNSRINWERPTVVTTNYGRDMLLDWGYSPAVVSRLSSFEVIRLTGEDKRTEKR
jgi:DNA replication protein DnaC